MPGNVYIVVYFLLIYFGVTEERSLKEVELLNKMASRNVCKIKVEKNSYLEEVKGQAG